MQKNIPKITFNDDDQNAFDALLEQAGQDETALNKPETESQKPETATETPPPPAAPQPSPLENTALVKIALPYDEALTQFALPEQFLDPQNAPQLEMLKRWWDLDKENAQLLVSLLLSFNHTPTYAAADLLGILVREISRCLTKCMEAECLKPHKVANVLEIWAEMLKKGKHKIQLRIPAVGANIESSWMTSHSNSGVINHIFTWAVYNSGGIVYSAEID